MRYRAMALAAPLVLGIAGLAVPPALQAQAATAAPRAVQLEFLSRERARSPRWAAPSLDPTE
jgi:hypothetical protein